MKIKLHIIALMHLWASECMHINYVTDKGLIVSYSLADKKFANKTDEQIIKIVNTQAKDEMQNRITNNIVKATQGMDVDTQNIKNKN